MSSPELRTAAVFVFGLTIAMALLLAVVKVAYGIVLRARAVRRAEYVAAVGEIISRGMKPDRFLEGWARDALFLEVVSEYLEVTSGKELEHLEWLIEQLDVRPALARRFGGRLFGSGRRMRRNRLPRWLPDPGAMRRLDAINKLATIPDDSVEPVFYEAMRDRQPEIRAEAARGLVTLRSVKAVPVLLEAIVEETPWVAYRIADQLASIGSGGVPSMLDWLQGSRVDAPNAHLIVRAIGLIGDLRATSALVGLMMHDDPEMRIAAATAIGRAGSADGIEALHGGLTDSHPGVRSRSAAALAHFSSSRSIPALEQALRDPAFWVRQNAAESLAEIPGGMNALRRATIGADPFAAEAALLQLGLKGEAPAPDEVLDVRPDEVSA